MIFKKFLKVKRGAELIQVIFGVAISLGTFAVTTEAIADAIEMDLFGTKETTNYDTPGLYLDGEFYTWDELKLTGKVTVENGVITNIDKNMTGKLVLGEDVTSVGYASFYNCSLSEVIITKNVKSVEQAAFQGSKNLTSVNIASDKIDLKHASFYGCPNLSSFSTSKGDICIGSAALQGCDKLSSVSLNGNNVKIDNNAFYNCQSLNKVEFKGDNISIGTGAFQGCNKLESVYIPSKVTHISDNAFYGCANLTINLENKEKPSSWGNLWNQGTNSVNWGVKK